MGTRDVRPVESPAVKEGECFRNLSGSRTSPRRKILSKHEHLINCRQLPADLPHTTAPLRPLSICCTGNRSDLRRSLYLQYQIPWFKTFSRFAHIGVWTEVSGPSTWRKNRGRPHQSQPRRFRSIGSARIVQALQFAAIVALSPYFSFQTCRCRQQRTIEPTTD